MAGRAAGMLRATADTKPSSQKNGAATPTVKNGRRSPRAMAEDESTVAGSSRNTFSAREPNTTKATTLTAEMPEKK